MAPTEEILALEREGWEALASPGGARPFYDRVLAEQVLMLLPGDTVLTERAATVEAMDGPPWSTFDLGEPRVIPLGPDAAVVAYRVSATRDDQAYTALCASTYRREADGWKLAVHQQTPV